MLNSKFQEMRMTSSSNLMFVMYERFVLTMIFLPKSEYDVGWMCVYNILWKDNGSWVALCHYLIPPIHHQPDEYCFASTFPCFSLPYLFLAMNIEHIFRKGILNRNIQHDYYDFSGYVAMPMFRTTNAPYHIIFSRIFNNNTTKSCKWRKKKNK